MPRASREYCKRTPITKMGFTQRASCKAQGLIARTSIKLKGKKVVSPKYRKSYRKVSRKSKSKPRRRGKSPRRN